MHMDTQYNAIDAVRWMLKLKNGKASRPFAWPDESNAMHPIVQNRLASKERSSK